MAASDHCPGAGGRCRFSWGMDAIKRARAAGVSVWHNNGVFSLDEGSKTRYVFSGGQFASSCPTGYGPRGFQVRVSLKGPQRCDLFVWSKDYGWTHITDSKPTSGD